MGLVSHRGSLMQHAFGNIFATEVRVPSRKEETRLTHGRHLSPAGVKGSVINASLSIHSRRLGAALQSSRPVGSASRTYCN